MTRLNALALFLVLSSGCATPQSEETAPAQAPAATSPGAMQVVPLQHASAVELEKVLVKALGSKVHGLRIVADPRTNALILTADNEAGLAQALELIAKLDVEAAGPPADAPAEKPK